MGICGKILHVWATMEQYGPHSEIDLAIDTAASLSRSPDVEDG